MKHIFYTIAILVFICSFLSCKEKKTSKPETAFVLHKENLKSKNTTVIPHSYAEKVTDTIFSNKYHVYIKQYTHKSRSIKIKTENKTTIYKDTIADVRIDFEGKTIVKNVLDIKSELFSQNLAHLDLSSNYLRNIWTEQLNPNHPDVPCILVELFNPETKYATTIMITPNNGTFTITELI
jgi:hypothetical protein